MKKHVTAVHSYALSCTLMVRIRMNFQFTGNTFTSDTLLGTAVVRLIAFHPVIC